MREKMKKVTVSKITTEDVDKVYQIEEIIHPDHHWSKDSFYNEISNNLATYYCVKDESNTILGFVGTWMIVDEAHITTFGVHPDFRRLQLGQVLMIQVLKNCYKNMVKYVTLEVRESNIPAISLYKKFLFESIGVRKNYYQDNGENALIMFTQNIWYDTFKNNFVKLLTKVNKVEVTYDE